MPTTPKQPNSSPNQKPPNNNIAASEMAQHRKVLAKKTDDLSLVPGNLHAGKREPMATSVIPWGEHEAGRGNRI